MKQPKKKGKRVRKEFKVGRGEIITAQFVELLPIRAAGRFITLKLNVIDDCIPLLLGIEAIEELKVSLEFPKNLMWTQKKIKTNQIGCGTSNMESKSG